MTYRYWSPGEMADGPEDPPAGRYELDALDALAARGVDTDALEPGAIDRLVRAEKARQAAARRIVNKGEAA